MTSLDRREREKQRRREAIVRAAEKLIFAQGLDNTTMEQVAEAADFSKVTVYHYFNSKEELYYAVSLRGLALLLDKIMADSKSRPSAMAKIRCLIDTIRAFSEQEPHYYQAMNYFHYSKRSMSAGELLHKKDSLIMKKAYVWWQEVIALGKETGEIRADLNPFTTWIIFMVQITGFQELMDRLKNQLEVAFEVDMETLYEDFFTCLTQGIKQ